jgi:hypothetical protein
MAGPCIWLELRDRDRVARSRAHAARQRTALPGPIAVWPSGPTPELSDFEIDDAGTKAALLWNVAGKSEVELST